MAGPLAGLDLAERLADSPLAGLAPATDASAIQPFSLQAGRATLTLPRLEAARLLMAWRLPGAADQDAVVGGDLLTTLLAEGRRSRLVERLREQLRLVESIDLDLNVLEAGCLVLLEAVCDPEQLEDVEREVRVVLEELLSAPPQEPEVERARRLIGNGYRFSLEAPGSVAAMVGNSSLWGRSHDLEAPLQWMRNWDARRLSRELIPLLHPDRAFSLQAVPA
jgi:predicted Zn-dependent peptidase